jgi:hypothetical protein
VSDFLKDLALGHQAHEGWYPGSRSYRNNNPGNLRAGKPSDEGGFTVYATYEKGLAALESDLTAKICGRSRHINYSDNPTFLTYVKVYAPSDDGNDPKGYCQQLCRALSRYNVQPNTPLSKLCQIVNGEIAQVPETSKPTIVSPEARKKGLERRLINTWLKDIRMILEKELERLNKRMSGK